MKRLLFAASALALAAAMSPAVTSSVQAAPAKSPFCKMAKGEKNPVSWNAYYHCLGPAEAARPEAAHRYVRTHRGYMGRRGYEYGRPAYAEYGRPAYAEYGRPAYAQYQPGQDNSQFCKMAKGQKNLVSWNAYYGCLRQR